MKSILQALRSDRGLQVAVLVAVLFRVAAFVIAILLPVPNERGEPVSPLLPPGYFDFEFYLNSLRRYASDPQGILQDFLRFYSTTELRFAHIVAGPVFPALIGITGFSAGYFLPLALIYVAMSAALATAWLYWLRAEGLRKTWLLLFAVLPQPVWFMLVVSPDLLFAAEFALFFLAYFSTQPTSRTWIVWTVALLLMVATRPNSFSVLLFVAAQTAWSVVARPQRMHLLRLVGIGILLIASALYLYPYFLAEMGKAGTALTYFGRTPNEYLSGLFPFVPAFLDVPASALVLLGAKAIYFVGLRPSYGVTEPLLVLARATPGLVLLPGFVYLFFKASRSLRLLVALYCLPFLVGPAQDRYYLPIYPVLFLYGARAYDALAVALSRSLPRRTA